MGRTRTKKTAARTTEVPVAATPSAAPSVPSLLAKAQSLIVQCDYELAQRFITRILEQQPSHAEAKEMLGVVQLETGEIEAARLVSRILRVSDIHFSSKTAIHRHSPRCCPRILMRRPRRLPLLIFI